MVNQTQDSIPQPKALARGLQVTKLLVTLKAHARVQRREMRKPDFLRHEAF